MRRCVSKVFTFYLTHDSSAFLPQVSKKTLISMFVVPQGGSCDTAYDPRFYGDESSFIVTQMHAPSDVVALGVGT